MVYQIKIHTLERNTWLLGFVTFVISLTTAITKTNLPAVDLDYVRQQATYHDSSIDALTFKNIRYAHPLLQNFAFVLHTACRWTRAQWWITARRTPLSIGPFRIWEYIQYLQNNRGLLGKKIFSVRATDFFTAKFPFWTSRLDLSSSMFLFRQACRKWLCPGTSLVPWWFVSGGKREGWLLHTNGSTQT